MYAHLLLLYRAVDQGCAPPSRHRGDSGVPTKAGDAALATTTTKKKITHSVVSAAARPPPSRHTTDVDCIDHHRQCRRERHLLQSAAGKHTHTYRGQERDGKGYRRAEGIQRATRCIVLYCNAMLGRVATDVEMQSAAFVCVCACVCVSCAD